MISKSRNNAGCLFSPIIYGLALLLVTVGLSAPMAIYYMRDGIAYRSVWIVDAMTYVALGALLAVPITAALVALAIVSHNRKSVELANLQLRAGQPIAPTPVVQVGQLPTPTDVRIERDEPEPLSYGALNWSVETPTGSIVKRN